MEGGSGVLRSQDGGVSEAPAFLQAPSPTVAAAGDDGGEPRRRGRPRRRPRSFEPGEGGGEAPEGGDQG